MNTFNGKSKVYMSVSYKKEAHGKCGLIACTRDDFYEVNGYDESFDGWGYEDIDFTKRLEMIDSKKHEFEHSLVRKIENNHINNFFNYKNSEGEKISKQSPFVSFRYKSNLQNYAKSQLNILRKNYRVNLNDDWGVI
mgnify:CR=1 FL=1